MITEPRDASAYEEMQLAVFKVDGDVRVADCRITGGHILISYASRLMNERLGDALNCVHSFSTNAGCGSGTACLDCTIRNSIAECLQSGQVVRKRVEVDLRTDSSTSRHKFMLTVNPYPESRKELAVMIVEDLRHSIENKRLALKPGYHRHSHGDVYHNIIEDYLIKYRNVIF